MKVRISSLLLCVWSNGVGYAFVNHHKAHRRHGMLMSSSSEQNLSAAAKERRKEETRKFRRQDEVVIGKTSAIPDAKDYPVNPSVTQNEYLQQASALERLVFEETERGMQALKLLDLPRANKAFDVVFENKPEAYLWQAGIVKYYLEDYKGAAAILEQAADFFEGRFQQVASEERIWQAACRLKMKDYETDQEEGHDEELQRETRKVHKIALDLFSASLAKDDGAMIVARAKLYDIACSPTKESRNLDVKLWRLTSWFYLALHYDALGDGEEESKLCCKAALETCPSIGNAQDIIHTLPTLHMMSRDFYDDDEIELAPKHTSVSTKESIQTSLRKLTRVRLQDILRKRDLKHCGSKQEVLDRVFHVLIEDV